MDESPACQELERRWAALSRILFGQELGALRDFEEWLIEPNDPSLHRKSSLSWKDVSYSIADYCAGSRSISFDEADFERKYPPLSINDVKDIDSVIGAARERVAYAGNIVLGNSKFAEKSSTVNESFYVYRSINVEASKYVAFSTNVRCSEHIFGCNTAGNGKFMLRCCAFDTMTRCFETWVAQNSSDCYYSHNVENCHNCMFCFNAKNLQYAIGNAQVGREKFTEARQALQEWILARLEKEGSISLDIYNVGCAKAPMP